MKLKKTQTILILSFSAIPSFTFAHPQIQSHEHLGLSTLWANEVLIALAAIATSLVLKLKLGRKKLAPNKKRS